MKLTKKTTFELSISEKEKEKIEDAIDEVVTLARCNKGVLASWAVERLENLSKTLQELD